MFRWFGPFCLVATLCGGYVVWSERDLAQPPGVIAPNDPAQRALATPVPPIDHAGWRLTPVAEFAVEARVLGKARYRWDATAALAPVDLALGWGAMSDSAVLAQLAISQSTRFFHYRYQSPPIPPEQIVRSASNMHMIPSTPALEQQMLAVRNGQVVRFSGYLVDATRGGGGEWRSSTSRTDSGAGACEIVYVTAFAASPL